LPAVRADVSLGAQTAIRIVLAARQALAEERAAVRIQSTFRGYWTRMVLLRQQELRRRIGAMQIQSVFRGWAWRARLGLMQSAVVMIQGLYRGHSARVSAHARQHATRVLQRMFRGYWSRQGETVVRRAVVRAQAIIRVCRALCRSLRRC
jgi:hypothetical protein